jgi:hypothetical protein
MELPETTHQGAAMSDVYDRQDWETDEFLLGSIETKKSGRYKVKPLASAMRRSIAKHNVASEQMNLLSTEIWTTVVGEQLAQDSRPGKIFRGKLIVQVTNNLVQQELAFQKIKIVREIQKLPEFAKIRDLKFVQKFSS